MERKGIEFTVGLFVVGGIVLLAGLIIYFGNFKEQFQSSYLLKVQLPNAYGLLEGAQVKYLGAPVGAVVSPPRVLDRGDKGFSVELEVRIDDGIEIRRGSKWSVGSSGLLGDAYIEVQPAPPAPAGTIPPPLLTAGDTVVGQETVGIADLASSAEPVLKKIDAVAAQLEVMAQKINGEILTPDNAQQIKEILAEVNDVLAKVDGILGGVDAATVRQIVNRVNGIVANVDKLMQEAADGNGIVYQLLADRKTGVNLAAFIENLRKHGVLFYSDSSGLDELEKGKEDGAGKKPSGPVLRELR